MQQGPARLTGFGNVSAASAEFLAKPRPSLPGPCCTAPPCPAPHCPPRSLVVADAGLPQLTQSLPQVPTS